MRDREPVAGAGRWRGEAGAPGAGIPRGHLVAVRTGDGRVVPGSVRIDPGPLAVTLVVDGLPLAELLPGTRLRVGPEGVVELAEPVNDEASAGALCDRTGPASVTGRVVTGGAIQRGDAIVLDSVRLPLQDSLDLHAFHPADVASVVGEYLTAARAAGLVEVRIVHGRGRGVQRETVRRLLATSPEVAAFGDAPPERGGWGATLVRLGQPGEPLGA